MAGERAAAGDTIAVGPGSYTGGIVITKALTLFGAGAGSTVISGGGPVITVSGAPVLIRAVTVTGGHAPATAAASPTTDCPPRPHRRCR